MDKISDLKEIVVNTLDLNKAQDIITIDLKDKSSMADYMTHNFNYLVRSE